MEKKNIKKITILLVVVCLVVGIGIDYCFFSPSKVNKYIASNLYKTPANNAFTDVNFYQCVVDAYNEVNKSSSVSYTTNLSDEQLESITTLNCNEKGIENTDGLESLTSLKGMYISGNKLTNLDVSNNTNLMYLQASSNQLTNLDISKNKILTDLVISNNQLTSIDLTSNSNLEILDVSANQLTLLNLEYIENLQTLRAFSNKIDGIKFGDVSSVVHLYLSNNEIVTFDLNNFTNLNYLDLSSNQLTSIDLSSDSNLEEINVSNNQLTLLNLEYIKNLKFLDASSNKIDGIKFGNVSNVTSLNLSNNEIVTFDLNNFTNLNYLDLSSNQLTSIDLSSDSNLEDINVSNNQLTLLNLEYIKNLKFLDASSNKIDGIKFGNVSNITSLNLSNNNLVNLDISSATALTSLDVSNNQLTNLNLSKNTSLSNGIYIDNNPYGKSVSPMFVGEIDIPDDVAVILPSHYKPEQYYYANPWAGSEPRIEVVDNKLKISKAGSYEYKLTSINPNYIETYTIEVVDISSDVYEIDKASYSINVGDDTDEEVKNNIVVENGTIDIEGDSLIVKYETEEVKRFELDREKSVEYSSNVYNLDNDYIYVGNDTDEEIRSNIVSDVDGIVKEINNNTLVIKYNNEIMASFDLIRVTSDKYNLDNYGIFGINGDYVKSNLNVTNGTLEAIENDEGLLLYINILYDGKVISNIPVHNISSDEYVITDEYIFTGFDGMSFDVNKIKTSSYVSVSSEYNKLKIKYYEELVGLIDLVYLNKNSDLFDVNEKTNIITFKSDVSYQKFMEEYFELENSNTSVRVVDQNGNEIESLENNYKFEVFYNSNLLKSYTIVVRDDNLVYTEDAEVVTVSLNEDILKNLKINDSFYNVRKLFETSGNVSVYDKYHTTVSMDNKIKTGDYFSVDFTEYKKFIYLSVLGDVNGSGDITKDDVDKSYNILRKKEEVEEVYYLATDANKDGKLKINDVAKLHQYVKGKISSLED